MAAKMPSPLYFAILMLLLASLGGSTAAALLLGGGSRKSRILRPSAFHFDGRSTSSQSSLLRSSTSNNDNHMIDISNDDSSSLRETIERLVSLIGPPDEDNIVQSPLDDSTTTDQTIQQQHSSIVHIIGTGLTPNLLSLPLSTLHLLSQADTVLYDSLGLAYEDICKIVPNHCEVICVGKRGDSKKSWKQSEIDDLILQMAMTPKANAATKSSSSKPKTILRLKGGDPFLFGRARTEIDTLKKNKIAYTYTPAISSCIAGPHLGGIPLTDPSLNCQSFGVWSGTDAFGRSRGLSNASSSDDENVEKGEKWEGLGVDTLVFLMIGRLDKLEALCNLLAKSGDKWEESTPCAVIQNAGGIRRTKVKSDDSSQKVQRVWRGTLGSIVPLIQEEDETRTSVSPAVFIVGNTCQLDFLSY